MTAFFVISRVCLPFNLDNKSSCSTCRNPSREGNILKGFSSRHYFLVFLACLTVECVVEDLSSPPSSLLNVNLQIQSTCYYSYPRTCIEYLRLITIGLIALTTKV